MKLETKRRKKQTMEKYIRESDAIQTVLDKPDMTEDEKLSIVRRLQAIPAADVVEVRHSHWIEEGLSLVCADCGWMQYHDIPYGYCPSCGAKMDGGQSE